MSNNIHNKEYRKKLIERYLNADSTSQEEGLLKDYFTNNSADEDEKDIAYLINRAMQGGGVQFNAYAGYRGGGV